MVEAIGMVTRTDLVIHWRSVGKLDVTVSRTAVDWIQSRCNNGAIAGKERRERAGCCAKQNLRQRPWLEVAVSWSRYLKHHDQTSATDETRYWGTRVVLSM